MAQIVDTPKRRAFMKKVGEQGWLGMTWPKEYGGSEGEGVYEYLLNEALAGRGGPQIGKGVGIIGKTLIAHGSSRLKDEFLPKILRDEVEFAVGYSEPDAGSDAASMKLKATPTERDGEKGWIFGVEVRLAVTGMPDAVAELLRGFNRPVPPLGRATVVREVEGIVRRNPDDDPVKASLSLLGMQVRGTQGDQ